MDVDGLALALDVPVERTYLTEDVSGKLQKRDDAFQIVVNAKHAETRQRFTIAHELGHFVLHRYLIGEGNVDDCAYRSTGEMKNNRIGPEQETEANRFAANLLMPADAIITLQNEGIEDAGNMAKRLKVSESAMSIRLGAKS